jgi:hypothetical protein
MEQILKLKVKFLKSECLQRNLYAKGKKKIEQIAGDGPNTHNFKSPLLVPINMFFRSKGVEISRFLKRISLNELIWGYISGKQV